MGKLILLIDDDVDFVESNRMLLEAFGYRIESANDGVLGLSMARALQPDLVVLDIMMAYDTEGIQVARQIRACPELVSTKILMVSGIVSQKELSAPLEPDPIWLPVERILDKPIDPDRLLREIERLLQEPGTGERG